jgi:predicted ATPase
LTVAAECFVRAVALAGEQGALLWELRAAAGCSRLKARLGRKNEARKDLSLVYDRFTEGFGSAELRAAKAILDEL